MRRAAAMWMLAGVVLGLACVATGGVYDDVKAWWHLDFADSGVVTDPNTIRDARNWFNVGDYKATSIVGSPSWTTVAEDFGPAGGRTLGGRGLQLHGNTQKDGFLVSNLAPGGDTTLLMRLRWDADRTASSCAHRNTLYTNGFDYSGNKGWLFELTGANGNPRLLYGKTASAYAGWTTELGKWYDLAIVLDENGSADAITFYRSERTSDPASDGRFQHVTQNVNWFAGEVNAARGTVVGYECGSFDGVLESVAVWDRALSTDEVRAAFGYPDPAWSLGIDNDSNVDFTNEYPGGNNYTIGEPWGKLSRAVTSYGNPQVNINFDLTADEAALQHVFHLDTDGQSGSVGFSVLVNGHKLATCTAASNADYLCLVAPGTLNAGANTLSLRYENGTGYMCWDWLELGGAWQVGRDNNSAGEFREEWLAPADYYVTDPEWKHLRRALTSGASFFNLHFNLSDELSDYAYLYTTRVVSQGGGTHPFDVLVNGTLVASLPASLDNTLWDVPISSAWLYAGDNVITLRYGDTSGWLQFDFHRLQAVPEPATLSLLGLGGLALLRRRRRR